MFNLFDFVTPTALAITSENLTLLWTVPLLGMAMIFSVLAILWGVVSMFKFIFAKPAKPVKIDDLSEPEEKAEAVEAPVVYEEETNDDELIAVITAAIVAYRECEEPSSSPNGFRVVSFRRANGGKAWNTK